METVYGVLLLHKCGQEISETNLHKVLTAAGAKVDATTIKATVSALSGVDIEKTIKEASIATAVAPAQTAPSGKPAEKKAEKPEEKGVSEEEAAAGLNSLFA